VSLGGGANIVPFVSSFGGENLFLFLFLLLGLLGGTLPVLFALVSCEHLKDWTPTLKVMLLKSVATTKRM